MIALFLIAFFGMMLFLGVPMVACIVFSALLLPLVFGAGSPVAYLDIVDWFVNGASANNTGITIALFMLAGEFMARGKLTEKIFNTFSYWLGKKKGFLPIISIATCMFYGAISGSGPATTAAVGGMCYPLLVSLGYDRMFSAAILVASGCLGMVIPPSVPLTGAAAISGAVLGYEVSTIALYKIAAVAGVLAGIILIIYAYIHCLRHGNGDQAKIDAMVDNLRTRPFSSILAESIWAIITPVIILGGIFTELTDPAQAAAISLVYGILVSVFVYKTVRIDEIVPITIKCLSNGVPLFIMLAAASVFSGAMTGVQIPAKLADAMVNSGVSGSALICLILLFMLILGTFMDSGGAMQIVVPLVAPLIVAMGMDLFTCLTAIVVAQAIGLTTPPFGLSMFVMCGVAECSVGEISKKLVLPILLLILVAFFVGLFPGVFAWALPV